LEADASGLKQTRRYHLRFTLLILALALLPVGAVSAAPRKAPAARPLSMQAVNDAEWSRAGHQLQRPLLVKLQILLDRAHASPGEIDGNRGENTRKAVEAFRELRNLGHGERIDRALWQALAEEDREPVLVACTITDKDVSGPFIDRVPEDYREKASLKHLSYTSPQELLAEKFHMSEQLLRELNPERRLIVVAPNLW
jgi:hypothetical protein